MLARSGERLTDPLAEILQTAQRCRHGVLEEENIAATSGSTVLEGLDVPVICGSRSGKSQAFSALPPGGAERRSRRG